MGMGSPTLPAAVEDGPQVAAVDVLERDVVAGVDDAEVEDLRDVRVVQLNRDLRLVDEHADEVLVLRDVRQDALDRDQALEALDTVGLGPEHLGHTADVDPLEEIVLSERDGLSHGATLGRCRARGRRLLEHDRRPSCKEIEHQTIASRGPGPEESTLHVGQHTTLEADLRSPSWIRTCAGHHTRGSRECPGSATGITAGREPGPGRWSRPAGPAGSRPARRTAPRRPGRRPGSTTGSRRTSPAEMEAAAGTAAGLR